MTITFECLTCSQEITAKNDCAGLEVKCPNCTRQLVIPTTIWRANQIVDRLSELLADGGSLGGMKFTSLSRVGASTRIEALRALYIVTAETFQTAFQSKTPDNQRILEGVVNAAGSTAFRVVNFVLPDIELDAFARLPDPFDPPVNLDFLSLNELENRSKQVSQHTEEYQRLQRLAWSDTACTQSETVESFVSFLRTLDPVGREYWPQVYQRIGLSCPLADGAQKAVLLPEPKKSWWRRPFA